MININNEIGLNPPPAETVIWHYMSMTKFLMLLNSQGLWFCRTDVFEDKNEGMFPRIDLQCFVAKYNFDISYIERDKKRTFINCWIQEDHELFLMWKSYVKDLTDGVAIKTTIGNLIKALSVDDTKKVYCAKVNYIDYNKEFCPCLSKQGHLNMYYYYFIKNKYFKQEQEVRLLYHFDKVNEEKGFYHPVNISTLIDSIYLSPKASNNTKNFLFDMLKSHNLCIPICDSEIVLK